MKIIKPAAMSCSPLPTAGAYGDYLAVSALVAFEVINGEIRAISEQSFWQRMKPALPPETAPDLGWLKPRGEWLAFGHAYPAEPNSVSTKVSVTIKREGDTLSAKTLHVSGPRTWQKRLNLAWPSEPEPLAAPVLLDWSLAFGHPKHEMNPKGLGGYDNQWVGAALPQIEYFEHMVASPTDTPAPAGLTPLPLTGSGRFKPWGTYDEQWRREVSPALPEDTSPEVLMQAPVDQRITGWFKAGDVIECRGMHPEGRSLRWAIPPWQARCFVKQPALSPHLIPVPMQLDTLLLLPGAGVLALLWRGHVPITDPEANDVDLVLTALESNDQPHDLAHYERLAVLRDREQKTAGLAMLDDSGLMPVGQRVSLLPALDPAMKKKMQRLQERVTRGQAKGEEMKASFEKKANEKMLEAKKSWGNNTPEMKWPEVKIPEPEPVYAELTALNAELSTIVLSTQPDGARLYEVLKRIEVLNQQSKAQGFKQAREGLEKMTEALAAQSDAQRQAAQDAKKAGSGPPSRGATARKANVANNLKFAGLTPEAITELQTKLAQGERSWANMYKQSAHYLPVVAPLAEPATLGAQILRQTKHSPLAGAAHDADWVGADLSGQNLDNCDLSQAYLDGANLSGASLVGADLRGACLAWANLTGANLTGANLEGANLGCATLVKTNFSQANLTRAVLDNTVMQDTCFVGARLDHVTMIGVQVGQTDFSEASFDSFKLIGMKIEGGDDPSDLLDRLENLSFDLEDNLIPIDLTQARFCRTNIDRALFLGAIGKNLDFTQTRLYKTALLHSKLTESNFTGALLEQLVVAMSSSLAGSIFSGASVLKSFLHKTDLSRTDFKGANLHQSHFGQADFTDADLSYVKAGAARFERANLLRTTFLRANLSGANFRASNLASTSFDEATLTLADFSKAKTNHQTSFIDAITTNAMMPKSNQNTQ